MSDKDEVMANFHKWLEDPANKRVFNDAAYDLYLGGHDGGYQIGCMVKEANGEDPED